MYLQRGRQAEKRTPSSSRNLSKETAEVALHASPSAAPVLLETQAVVPAAAFPAAVALPAPGLLGLGWGAAGTLGSVNKQKEFEEKKLLPFSSTMYY